MTGKPKRRARRRGSAVVEFAIVAPVLLLLLFGMIEFARLLMVKQAIAHASYEGARQASLKGTDELSIQQATNRALTAAGLSRATITITPDVSSRDAGRLVGVTVAVRCQDVSWLNGSYLGPDQLLTATTTARCE